MSRPIKLYPGSDRTVLAMPFWCDVHEDQDSTELWIDVHAIWSYEKLRKQPELESYDIFSLDKKLTKACENIVFYDWFHGQAALHNFQLDWVRKIAKKRPVTWITLNPKPIPGIQTIKFDYYWNRSKRAFLDREQFHKVGVVENYIQYPIHTNPRSKKFLTYHARSEKLREKVRKHLIDNYDGFYNDPSTDQWLLPNVPNEGKYSPHCVCPPTRSYYDDSYATCLVETQYFGTNGHLVSEKTYDNLLQGRAVLNFATPGFHHYLEQSGWHLPTGIDWSWDLIVDDQQRLTAYLAEIDKLFSRSQTELHEWFISNIECWKQNQEMLRKKPYDVVDLGCIKI